MLPLVVTAVVGLPPVQALAQEVTAAGLSAPDTQTFMKVLDASLRISDWLATGSIMFAGAQWMFGHRTKALEQFLGACVGYLIIRKAPDIVEFLHQL